MMGKRKSVEILIFFNEFKLLSSSINIIFCRELRSAYHALGALTKPGIDGISLWEGIFL